MCSGQKCMYVRTHTISTDIFIHEIILHSLFLSLSLVYSYLESGADVIITASYQARAMTS